MSIRLASAYPTLGDKLPLLPLADLPTPVAERMLTIDGQVHAITVKQDDLTATAYGGNKVRKLEYVLQRALDRGARRVATFGAVGSNHAIATAVYAQLAGLGCTCFLSHQSLKPGLGRALRFHQQLGTEVVAFGGSRSDRIATLRRQLHGRRAWVIPLGGSSWLGTIGFVDAGLELAAQVHAGTLPEPARVYIPLGTMGSAAGLALGLALAGLATEVQAIRVTDERYANAGATTALMRKTVHMLRHHDRSFPARLADRARLVCRDEFFGSGYGRSNAETGQAIALAAAQAGLTLEATYSGKTMAAVVSDLRAGFDRPTLFWNTYNSAPLAIDDSLAPDFEVIPREFERYFG